jgi:hypothetical protein
MLDTVPHRARRRFTLIRNAVHLGRSFAATAAIVAALFVAQSVSAPAAYAATGVTRVTATSESSSTTTRTVSAICPAGQRVFGGGAEIVNGQQRVLLERLQPRHDATDDRFIAGASELPGGFTANWQLRAFAICGAPLSGMQIISGTSPTSSTSPRSLAGVCPDGQREVGFGARINNGAGQVRLTDLYDFFGPPSSLLIVAAREDADGYAGNWSLSSYTICADASATDGFVLVGTTSPTNSTNKSVVVTCPAGTQVYTTGELVQAAGPATTASLLIDRVSVDAPLASATVRVTESPGGTTGTWTLVGFALCGPGATPVN